MHHHISGNAICKESYVARRMEYIEKPTTIALTDLSDISRQRIVARLFDRKIIVLQHASQNSTR